MTGLFGDRDKRRALGLTLLVHLLALLTLTWIVVMPDPSPPETFIVIDLGAPEPAERADAPTVDEAALNTPTPQVAAREVGTPQPVGAEATTDTPSETPPPPTETASAPEETGAATSEAASEESIEAAPEGASEEVAEAEPESTPAEPEMVAEAPAPTPPPTPQASVPEPEATPLASAEVPLTTTLPPIDEVELEPQPLAREVTIPLPTVSVQTPAARVITATPQVSVAEARALPQPQIETLVAEARALPQPQVEASVAARNIPQPQVETSVAEARAVPRPQVEASVTPARSVPQPQVQASVTPAQPLPQPQVQTSVARAVPQPQVQASVPPARTLPQPEVRVAVPEARPLAVTPQVEVAPARAVPSPNASATVTSPESTSEPATEPARQAAAPTIQPATEPAITPITEGADREATGEAAEEVLAAEPALEEAAEGAAGETPATTEARGPAGGNAGTAGQAGGETEATGLGVAARPDGGAGASGTPAPDLEPYSAERLRPLAVLLDNTNQGYPQAGLREASAVYEVPVEGGITRLMTTFDQVDPVRVGPIRSARDYFVDLAQGLDGILVHVGGAPSAFTRIAQGEAPTLDALETGELFAREGARDAPYNLYSQGRTLREAVNRLRLNRARTLQGRIYRPGEEAQTASGVEVGYVGNYTSGFRYLPETNLYRWQRAGQDASDAGGEAVLVEAVVVAHIDAVPIPNDPEGRLYIPMNGGDAALYLRGKRIEGRWTSAGGFEFIGEDGESIDLTPFKHWVLFAPREADVAVR